MPSVAHAVMLDNLKQKIEVTFLGLLFPKQANINKIKIKENYQFLYQ
jgi:hypothetical protein